MGMPLELDHGESLLEQADTPESVLLRYQSDTNDRIKHPANDNAAALPLLLVIEKSRRIGITWGVAMPAALTAMASKAAGGQNVYYMGYNLEMARDFIETCAHWLRALNVLAVSIEETVFSDGTGDKDIKAYRIDLPSGHSIVALPSAPRVLRGKQGLVIIDEAAFHDDLNDLMKAAIALTFWGKGQVVVISTHNGENNRFNLLIEEIRADKRSGEVIRITFEDALADGLYKRICEVCGIDWSADGEADWEDELRSTYGEDADEELDVIPSQGSGVVLPRTLIKARMTPDYHVIRIELGDDFVHLPDDVARARLMRIIEEHIDPHLAALDAARKHYFGMDFARIIDLSVLPVGFETPQLDLHVPFVIEMRNVPFREQQFILFYVIERLPNFMGGKMDARGNGQMLAENAQRKFGYHRIEAVMASDSWYLENMPSMVARFPDGTILTPADDHHVDDLAALKRIKGVIKLTEARTGKAGAKRHGDYAIALVMLNSATHMDVLPVDAFGTGIPRASLGAWGHGEVRGRVRRDVGWGTVGGGRSMRGF